MKKVFKQIAVMFTLFMSFTMSAQTVYNKNVGYCYEDPLAVIEIYNDMSRTEKIELAKDGDVEAIYFLGVDLANEDDNYADAFKCFKFAAEKGNAYAQNELGKCYLYGDGVEADYEKAVYWLEQALDNGDDNAIWPLIRIGVIEVE